MKIKCVVEANQDCGVVNKFTGKPYYREKIIDIPDEEFLNKKGFSATNIIFDKAENELMLMKPPVIESFYICEEGLAKDIPYLDKGFETIEEMREYLSRPEIINLYDEA